MRYPSEAMTPDLIRALGISAAALVAVVVLIIIVSAIVVRRGESAMAEDARHHRH
jgi:hypothetical protein